MKLSFVKTIQGHEIEFVRLLYPLRYELYVRNDNANPLKLALNKDKNGAWSIANYDDVPAYIREITLPIQNAIEENESSSINK